MARAGPEAGGARGGRCAESGYLLVASAARHLGAGAFDRAHADAGQAADIGERLTEPDLVALARSTQGRAAIRRGEVGTGLTLLDEAMVAVSTGEVLPLVAGLVYCSAITTCQQACALDRAREWTSALARWCGSQPQLVTFTGACLVHRAEILRLGGEWAQAIEEARHACERARGGDGQALRDGLYEEAEIHRLRGELREAEEVYRRSSQLGREPQPGLALLRLAQGRQAEAAGAIRRVLVTTSSAWKRARLLPASVEILLASGEIEEARSAAHELEELAHVFSTEALGAMAAHARGAVRLAEGDAQGSVESLRSGFETWHRLGAPYVAAKIRALLGHAYLALGDPDGARLELDAARSVFEQLGAAPDLAALGAPFAKAAPAHPHGLSRRELEVLRLVASGRTNKAIGKDLCISERTIDRHVSNIFAKLHVSSRAAATAFAYEHELV